MMTEASARRIWHPDERLPIPVLGWIGFGLSLATLLVVIIVAANMVLGAHAAWPIVVPALSMTLYAGGLAWGWHGLRPRAGRQARLRWAAAGLLLQGATYLVFWLYVVLGAAAPRSNLPAAFQGESFRDVILLATCMQFFLLGPVFGALAAWAGDGGERMAFVQVLGIVAFFYVWSLA